MTEAQRAALETCIDAAGYYYSELDQNKCVGTAEREKVWAEFDAIVAALREAFGDETIGARL